MNEGQIKNVTADFRISPLASYDEITTTHCPIYLSRYIRGELSESEIRNIGFPWSMDGVNRSLSSVGGTVSAACSTCLAKMAYRKVNTSTHLESKSRLFWAAHMAGGTHHAFYDRGEGFCVFSDIAVAANVVRSRYPEIAKRILIIDLDVHQGNGNAVLFKGNNLYCNYYLAYQDHNHSIMSPLRSR
jgi:acetoin utilization deacetylase AcuC-like enzyme